MRNLSLYSLALSFSVLATGCSGGHGGGAGADASADSDAMDASATAVKVTVTDQQQPVAGVHVVFHRPDGEVLAQRVTDADGVATAAVTIGGLVTVLTDEFGSFRARTIGGLQPDDEIELRDFLDRDQGGVEQITVNFPGAFAAAAGYSAANGCATSGSAEPGPAELEVDADCRVNGTANVHVVGYAVDGDGSALAHSIARDNPGAVVNLPPWSTSFSEISIAANGAPAGMAALAIVELFMLDNVVLEMPGGAVGVEIEAGSAVATVKVPAGIDSAIVGALAGYEVAGDLAGTAAYFASDGTVPTSAAIDLTEDLLPPALAGTVNDADRSRPAVAWTVGSIDADLLRVFFEWSTEDFTRHEWHLFLPGDTGGMVRLPALPAALEAYRPTVPGDDLYVHATYFDGTLLDWDQVRRSGGDLSFDDPQPPFMVRFASPAFAAGGEVAPRGGPTEGRRAITRSRAGQPRPAR